MVGVCPVILSSDSDIRIYRGVYYTQEDGLNDWGDGDGWCENWSSDGGVHGKFCWTNFVCLCESTKNRQLCSMEVNCEISLLTEACLCGMRRMGNESSQKAIFLEEQEGVGFWMNLIGMLVKDLSVDNIVSWIWGSRCSHMYLYVWEEALLKSIEIEIESPILFNQLDFKGRTQIHFAILFPVLLCSIHV